MQSNFGTSEILPCIKFSNCIQSMDATTNVDFVWNPPQISPRSTLELVALGEPQKDEEYPDNFFRRAKW